MCQAMVRTKRASPVIGRAVIDRLDDDMDLGVRGGMIRNYDYQFRW